jgi:hypothetical protein
MTARIRRTPNGTAAASAQVHNASARLAARGAPGLDDPRARRRAVRGRPQSQINAGARRLPGRTPRARPKRASAEGRPRRFAPRRDASVRRPGERFVEPARHLDLGEGEIWIEKQKYRNGYYRPGRELSCEQQGKQQGKRVVCRRAAPGRTTRGGPPQPARKAAEALTYLPRGASTATPGTPLASTFRHCSEASVVIAAAELLRPLSPSAGTRVVLAP